MTRRPGPADTGDHAHAPSTPAWTPPLDESQYEAWFDGEDAIVALREYDVDREYELPLDIRSFRLGGSRSCEISLPGRGLSAVHCLLERRGRRLLVHDQQSTHGTIHDGRKIEVAELHPGDCFTAVPVTFVALNQELRTQRPLLVELLGTDVAPWSPDRLMIEAARGAGNLLITGEAGCEHGRLARAIHAMSLRRNRPFVECLQVPADRAAQAALIKRAARSTLMLAVTNRMPALDPTFCSMLFSPDYHVRVIVTAPAHATARRAIPGEHVDQMPHVWIPPVRARAADLPAIFDRLLAERGAPIRFADLTDANRARLLAHDWRGNWSDLRTTADRLTAIARAPGWEALDRRDRATMLGIAKSCFPDWSAGRTTGKWSLPRVTTQATSMSVARANSS